MKRTIILMIASLVLASVSQAQQPNYRAQFVAQYGDVAARMLSVFDPNLPVLAPNADPSNWSVVTGTFTRTGLWQQPNGYPIVLSVVSGPGPAVVAVHPNGIWTFSATVSLEWQVWRIRAQNVLTPEQIAELTPGTVPASVDVLVFVRGIPALPNDPPILYFIFGGTA